MTLRDVDKRLNELWEENEELKQENEQLKTELKAIREERHKEFVIGNGW